MRTILKEETWVAFFKGHVSSQGLAAVFMAAEVRSHNQNIFMVTMPYHRHMKIKLIIYGPNFSTIC